MAQAALFSRLQLAKALLEYDNDENNEDAPHRSAHDSAIFAPFRAHAESQFHLRSNSRLNDYLGVSLPSETASLGGRESVLDHKRSRSRASFNTLRNPFGAESNLDHDDDGEEGDGEDEMEVDLASWGLDAFMDKGKESNRRRTKSAALPNPHPVLSVRSHQPYTNNDAGPSIPRTRPVRSMSVGNIDHLTSPEEHRRKSFGSPLDLMDHEQPSQIPPFQHRRAVSHNLIQSIPTPSLTSHPIHSIPFPTSSVRSPSPLTTLENARSSTYTSRFDPKSGGLHERSYSSASMPLTIGEEEERDAPRMRTVSNGTMGSLTSRALLADDNPFALRPPSRASRFDPKAAAHARTMSNASMGSRILLDNDGLSVMTGQGRERRYSTMELLRPKVLVMPSPLQRAPAPPPPVTTTRDGFHLSTDGPPLPPGARSARRSSATLSAMEPSTYNSAPIASNSFTPNPRSNLTLSQLTFRNTLMVGGQRDVTYADIDATIPRATEDGEQMHTEIIEAEPTLDPQVDVPPEDSSKPNRPAGKLFGRSLIDDLENRKARMRSKQRVFQGDDRPSMMARPQVQRSSTLIDPATLQAPLSTQARPVSRHMSSFGSADLPQAVGRRNSANAKPLLNFDDDDKIPITPNARIPQTRSVFGVDTLWEREMVKLRSIEAKEKLEEEARRARELEEVARENKKRAKKGKRKKGQPVEQNASPEVMASTSETTPQNPNPDHEPSVIPSEPPILPAIPKASRRPPVVADDESESDDSDLPGPSRAPGASNPTPQGWVSSDDEDARPTRTTGVGPRFRKRSRDMQLGPARNEESDDEDLPLSANLVRAVQKAKALHRISDSDDETQPLSALLQKTKLSLPSINFDRVPDSNRKDNDDEDDEPLGLRASRVAPSSQAFSAAGGGDDDDTPLAFHPEQQRRSQYHMMAQQQQQFLMQAQLQSNMFFSPSMMNGSGFFAPPMGPMTVQPPMPMPSPPIIHDSAKYGRVDRWRHDVAVEGQ